MNIRPVSVVVVDFPFVPVIATMRPLSQRDASSISPITGTPACRAAATCGCSERNAGAQHEQVGAVEGFRPMLAKLERDAGPAELRLVLGAAPATDARRST